MSRWDEKYEVPLVSIMCLVYNHEKFIEDALKGFLIQETDFPFEVLIHDDASTDRTADIIRGYEKRYPHIVKPIYQKENQWSKNKGVIREAQYGRTQGKYISLCEGDDYWCDPSKLQMQVKILDNNDDCGLVFTNAKINKNGNDSQTFYKSGSAPLVDLESLIIRNGVITLTAMYRKDTYDSLAGIWRNKSWLMCDYPQWIEIASLSEIKYIDKITGVYRVISGSLSQHYNPAKRKDFLYNYMEISLFYIEYLNLNNSLKETVVQRYLKSVIDLSFLMNDRSLMLDEMIKSFKADNFKDKIKILLLRHELLFYLTTVIRKGFLMS